MNWKVLRCGATQAHCGLPLPREKGRLILSPGFRAQTPFFYREHLNNITSFGAGQRGARCMCAHRPPTGPVPHECACVQFRLQDIYVCTQADAALEVNRFSKRGR
uniref:Uncharacterized protein n=1 Tax=Anguilla anguilla TaxID=7936 RepID=A0A0E9WMR8_ANGAN